MLSINESFVSIQGEGLHSGVPMYFLRLQGCTVGCHFCDTKYTWQHYKDKNMTNELEIIKDVLHNKMKWLCITGGEPYEQDLTTILELAKDNGINTHIETSGSVWQDALPTWICLSPKDLFHKNKKKRDKRFDLYASEIKCVVTKDTDIDYYLQEFYYSPDYDDKVPMIFQPVDNNVGLIPTIQHKIKGLDNCRVMLQTHKIMNLR